MVTFDSTLQPVDSVVTSHGAHALLSASPFAFPRPTDEAVKNARIMIIDDEEAVTKLLGNYLCNAGFRTCSSVCDARHALTKIAEEEPDVVLLDIQMKPLGGLEILESMRRDQCTQHIPVIILTSAADEVTKITALNLGANDFLTKPVPLSELLARVRNTLSAKAYHDQVAAHNLQLETDAFCDPLTGIANRRAFDYEIKRRMVEVHQSGASVGVLMIDIDHFKAFNDRYGHRTGDAVLRAVAEEACRCVRDTDLVARYGGEEFAVILPSADLSKSKQVAERLCASIAKKPHIVAGQALHVTVSVGVANVVTDDDTDSLVRRADEALYAAKNNGRNNVHFHDGYQCRRTNTVADCGGHERLAGKWRCTDPVERAKIAIVDDEPATVALAKKYLKDAGYESFVAITQATEALSIIDRESPDLVLLDIHMPEVDGFAILESLRRERREQQLPVLILTSATDEGTKVKALSLAANDFLEKPLRPGELVARVRNTLMAKAFVDHLAGYSHELEHQVRERTAEVMESRRKAIQCLARCAELRDDQTGQHVLRVGRYAALIADELGFSSDRVMWIEHAAQLHDVGKIGVPDDILRKPGELTAEEFDIMKLHCEMGYRVLQAESMNTVASPHETDNSQFPDSILELAASVAATHHEKWDGTGYPRALAGREIPIEGRITAVADVFDALSNRRPYKDAFSLDRCFLIMEQNRGSHFDPHVLDAFLHRKSDVERIFNQFAAVPEAAR